MDPSRATDLIDHVRRIARSTGDGIPLDHELLGAFVTHRDEAAFEALVMRHGPMVLSVCRRLLQNHHDVEDAFQAVFLVLARKASSVKPRRLVGNWLYGVAYRTALEARTVRRKRLAREKTLTEMPEPAMAQAAGDEELQLALHEELHRLPEHYRTVIVLCDLEGKTQKEAARQLGCPPGTVACRLTRGRSLLARRLVRRGLTLSAGAVVLALSGDVALAGLPASLVVSTVTAATTIASGGAATSVVSAKVAALSQGVLTNMMLTKLKIVVAVIVTLAFAGIGAGLLALPALVPGQPPAAQDIASQAANSEKARSNQGKPRETLDHKPRLDLYRDPLPEGAVARLGTVRFRHGGQSSFAVEFLRDGNTIISGGEDGKLCLWDAATGKLRDAVRVLENEIWCMALAPDGKTCAVAGPGGTAIWDVEARKLLHTLKTGSVSALAFSPNGKTLVTGGEDLDALLRVYDVATGKERRRMKCLERPISRILIGPDNRTTIWLSPAGRKVHISDLESGEETRIITNKNWGRLNAVELLPDGKTVLIAASRFTKDSEGMVEFHDLETGKMVRHLEKIAASITGARLLPGGKEWIAVDSHGNVWRYDVATWKQLPPLPGPGWFDRIAPDGRTGLRLAGTSLAVYDLATGKPRHAFDGHTGVIESLAFSREGGLLASVQSGTDVDIRVWEVAKSKTVRKLIGHPARQAFVCGIASAPGGFVTGASDGTLRLWDGASGKQLRLFQLAGREQVLTMTVSADGKRLICSSGGFELRRQKVAITVFDLATGKQLSRREENGERVFPDRRYFAPDGRTLVKRAEKGLVRVEVETGKELCRFTAPDNLEDPVAFTPDGRLLAVRSYTEKKDGPRYQHGERKVRVFDAETGKQRFAVDSDGWMQPLAFTPNGRLLAAAAAGGVVLFDSATGQERWRSPQLDVRIAAVAFAPDGKTLASGQRDGTILIWDITHALR